MIRMRTVPSSVSVTTLELLSGFPSVSVLHTVMRNLSKPFSASYFDSLASSSSRYFSVSCTIRSISDGDTLLATILWLIVGSTHSSASFDVTLSLFTVVQPSEPHCPPCLAWASLTTSSSGSQPCHQFPLLTSCPRTPAYLHSVPFQRRAFRVVHLTHLPLLDMNYLRFWRTSTLVALTLGTIVFTLRVILTWVDTFSQLLHLSGQLLSHITLCVSATSYEGLVSSTLRSSSTLKRLPINCSSSLIGLFLELSSLPGSLVTLASISLVLHLAALSPGCWVS